MQPLWRTVWRFLKKNKIGAGSVCGVRVGVVQGSVQRGGLGGLPTPHGPVCRAHARYPAFAPGSSEVAAGFFIFLYLVVHNLPHWACEQLVLILCSSFFKKKKIIYLAEPDLSCCMWNLVP